MGSPASAPASSPVPQASTIGSAKKAFTGDPEKRSFREDKVDTKRTGSNVRDSCIGLIYNGLAFRSIESSTDVIAKAVAVEHAAYVHFKHDEGEPYKKKIRSLFSNLKTRSNKDLGKRVMSGDILPEKFVVMTDEELKSEDQRKKEEELEKENMKKAQVPMAEKSISDSLECGRCKQKKVSYTQAQTRSADEPMTTFCECMNCGHRWKVCSISLGTVSPTKCLPLPRSSLKREDGIAHFAPNILISRGCKDGEQKKVAREVGVSICTMDFMCFVCFFGPSKDGDAVRMGVMEVIHQFRHVFFIFSLYKMEGAARGCCGLCSRGEARE